MPIKTVQPSLDVKANGVHYTLHPNCITCHGGTLCYVSALVGIVSKMQA